MKKNIFFISVIVLNFFYNIIPVESLTDNIDWLANKFDQNLFTTTGKGSKSRFKIQKELVQSALKEGIQVMKKVQSNEYFNLDSLYKASQCGGHSCAAVKNINDLKQEKDFNFKDTDISLILQSLKNTQGKDDIIKKLVSLGMEVLTSHTYQRKTYNHDTNKIDNTPKRQSYFDVNQEGIILGYDDNAINDHEKACNLSSFLQNSTLDPKQLENEQGFLARFGYDVSMKSLLPELSNTKDKSFFADKSNYDSLKKSLKSDKKGYQIQPYALPYFILGEETNSFCARIVDLKLDSENAIINNTVSDYKQAQIPCTINSIEHTVLEKQNNGIFLKTDNPTFQPAVGFTLLTNMNNENNTTDLKKQLFPSNKEINLTKIFNLDAVSLMQGNDDKEVQSADVEKYINQLEGTSFKKTYEETSKGLYTIGANLFSASLDTNSNNNLVVNIFKDKKKQFDSNNVHICYPDHFYVVSDAHTWLQKI